MSQNILCVHWKDQPITAVYGNTRSSQNTPIYCVGQMQSIWMLRHTVSIGTDNTTGHTALTSACRHLSHDSWALSFSHSGESCDPELILCSLFQSLEFKGGVLARHIMLLVFHLPPCINHSEQNMSLTVSPPTGKTEIQICANDNNKTSVNARRN
jgi:hypothetical protein